ncbi:uncharacterized protein LACBIDRAFT_393541 [Laccaria bicolor S238N-H82]|uniref:Predicted protein n=1 Tax=Laccaria bicolor (strain S238N-H82 / ATCC MYA-4686) TaxID=486041 RepID=B0DRL0_LACBS|nr:uncharacterized protein LACBIDRAFT_393541 [Laccaria bicolor S238N-H82]EDR02889.1 predicted protein [Laccaria bicolor S238N-H82]|eukprot:XP_001886599.1 predicted protein [Laccaria bicolor S238N-H82]
MSNQSQNKKTRFLSPSAIRNSWKSFRSRSSSSNNAAQTQTGQSAHVTPSGTTSPPMSRLPSTEGRSADVQSSPSASVAVVGSSKQDPSSSLPVKEFARDVLSGGYEVVKILKECSGLCPPLKTALSGFIECVELYKRTSGNHEEMERILKIISDLGSELAVKLAEPRDQTSLDRIMKQLLKSLEEEDKKIMAMIERGFLVRLARNSDHAGKLVSSCNAIKDALHLFLVGLTLLIERNTRDILKNVVFQTLPRSHDAAFTAAINLDNISRGPCTKDTRVDVIKQIMEWVKETDSTKAPSVYWLTGLAGLGKTTIAYTICEELKAAHVEFVSFFCSRQLDSKNSKLLITTICRDLAALFSSFASQLLPVLEKDSNIAHARLPLQLEELFTNPWKASLSHRQCLPLPVVVVDALDESDHGTEFLKVLLDAVDSGELSGIKFLVTSRPEPTLFDLCKSFPPNAVCKLYEIDVSNVQKDIEKYLSSALPDLKDEPNLVKLASQAQGFFIYAATAVRFISSPSQPFSVHEKRKQLQNIVNSWPVSSRGSERNAVNELYQKILGDAFSDERICDERLPILHTVLCAESRITMSVIAHLSDNDQDTVEKTIESLHPVLFISSKDECVYWYHTSFLDFIFTQATAKFSIFLKQGCPSQEINVFCDKVAHHAILACQCFIIMRKLLHFNMCNLKSSFQFDSDVLGLNGEKLRNLSPVLRYASRHWATHLSQAATADDESNELLQFLDDFMCNKLLFWIEAMNLIGHKFECPSSLKDAEEWFKKGIKPLGLLEYLSDAAGFSAHFAGSYASESTPHLYISALSTWYQDSPVWTHWKHRFTALPSITLLKDAITVPLLTITTNKHITSASVSGRGDQIVTHSKQDSSLLIWDIKTGHLLKKLQGHTDVVWSVAFSSNGNQIASCSKDKSVRLWDAKTGHQIINLQGHSSDVQSVAFSPDCSEVVSGSHDFLIKVWDTKTGKLLREFESPENVANSLVFSPDSHKIASGAAGGSVWVWDAKTGDHLIEMQGHSGWVSSVSFSPDSHKVVSGSFDRLILLWDADTGHILSKLQGHSAFVLSVAFSPDGNQIVSGSRDHSVCVWDAKIGHLLRKLQGHTNCVGSVTFLPDGQKIISSSHDGSINVWDAKTGQLREQEGHANSVTSVSFSPDGHQIVSGSLDNSVRVWETKSGHQLKELQGHADHVSSVMFSPDGNQIVSGSYDHSIKIWDVKTGHQLKTLQGHSDWVLSVVFSPDGHLIVSGSGDKSVCLWDTKTGYQLKKLKGHTHMVGSVAFSPQGDYIVSGSWDQSVWVWDVKMGHHLMKLQGHTDHVYSVTFSPDGRQIMSCSLDNSIRLWDIKTGQQLMQLHNPVPLSAAFSPDSHQIISGSCQLVQVWDAKTGQKLRVLKGHTSTVDSVAFSPDGNQIVSGSSDHSVRVWNANKDDQLTNLQKYHNPIDLAVPLNDDNQIKFVSGDQFIGISANSHVDTLWVINEDGWICFASNHLVWIPPTICKVLHHPHSILIISQLGSAKISFKDSKLGLSWHECYTP